ncbi:unnamed protein product [Fusarium graminearum]|nr:unnamed protein product [Fusarium graminearum]
MDEVESTTRRVLTVHYSLQQRLHCECRSLKLWYFGVETGEPPVHSSTQETNTALKWYGEVHGTWISARRL